MSNHEQTAVDRARTLVGGARLLVARGRLTREAAREAMRQSTELLARLSLQRHVAGSPGADTPVTPQPAPSAEPERRQSEPSRRPGRRKRKNDRPPAVADQRRLLVVGPDEA